MRERITNPNTGDWMASLDFRPVTGAAEVAKVDDAEITRHRDGRVQVTLATRRGFKTYAAESVAAAILVYGLTTATCNGLPGVLPDWDRLAGTAGRD